MKSKILLKRTLPIIIALFVAVVLALVSLVVTTDKKVPSFKDGKGEESYLVYSSNGVEIKLTNQDVYDLLRDQNNGGSTTIKQMVRMIDTDLLTNGSKNYVSAVEASDVNEKVCNAILSEDNLEDYLEDNEESFKLKAKKTGKTYAEYAKEVIEDKIDSFVESMNSSYALNVKATDIEYSLEEKTLTIKSTSDAYTYYALEVAKYNYAREVIEEDYYEDFEEYYGTKEANYEDGYAYLSSEYTKYTAALERYESDLETWKEADKKTRGDKPVKKDYLANYSVDEEPEEVDAPVLVESTFSSLYNEENLNEYSVVLVTYSSETAAKNALAQAHAKIEDGKWLSTDNGNELSDAEVEDVIVTLYKQAYKGYDKENLITGSKGNYVYPEFNDESELYYTQSTLSSNGLYSENSTNEFENFGEEGIKPYNTELQTNIFYIVAKNSAIDWDDYKGDKEYYETEFYNKDNIDELLDDSVTTTYINEVMAELRYDAGLLIYDEELETVYMGTYTSDYEATKRSSKYAVCSYEVNGTKKEITVNDLFDTLANTEYGVSSFIYTFQYDWMFLQAKNENDELYNVYFDYAKYKNGTALKKCIYDTEEASEVYEDAKEYLENVKESFKDEGYYDADEESGYPSSYGWLNFLKDYYYENYNANINSEDDLLVFYIYQEINSDITDDLKELSLTKWALCENYMAKTFAQYMNVSVEEFVIYAVDEDGNTIDPINWTEEQYDLAKELYDEILALIPQLEEDEINEVFADIVSAFDDCEKEAYDGGAHLSGLEYDYTYFAKDRSSVIINLSKYKTAGFKLTSTSATLSDTTSVEQLKYAGRLLWNEKLSELIKGEALEDLVIFDKTYTPKAYNAKDENGQVVATNDNYLVTNTGFVVMCATSMSMSSYFKDFSSSTSDLGKLRVYANMTAYEKTHEGQEGYKSFAKLYEEYLAAEDKTAIKAEVLAIFNDDMALDFANFDDLETYFENYAKDQTILYAFPDKVYAVMYLYDSLNSDDDDYTSLTDLYDDYEEALNDSDATEAEKTTAKDAIANVLTKYINNTELEINLSFDEFYEYLTNYADDDTSSFRSTNITDWFTTYSSGSATLAYGDLISTDNTSIAMLNDLLAGLNNITASDAVKALVEDIASDEVESYESNLTCLDACDYDDVKALLEALAVYKEFDFTDADNLTVLFNSSEYATEKVVFANAINNFKTYASELYTKYLASEDYSELDATEIADLNDLAIAAGLVK